MKIGPLGHFESTAVLIASVLFHLNVDFAGKTKNEIKTHHIYVCFASLFMAVEHTVTSGSDFTLEHKLLHVLA